MNNQEGLAWMESEQDIREKAYELIGRYGSIYMTRRMFNELTQHINRINEENRHFFVVPYNIEEKIKIHIHSKHHPDWKGSKP